MKGHYLSSNVNITVQGHNGQNVSVPVGCKAFAHMLALSRHLFSPSNLPQSTIRQIQHKEVSIDYFTEQKLII
jgi:hypothetical protein